MTGKDNKLKLIIGKIDLDKLERISPYYGCPFDIEHKFDIYKDADENLSGWCRDRCGAIFTKKYEDGECPCTTFGRAYAKKRFWLKANKLGR